MTTQAVLFDLDGTLLHTVPDLAAAVNAMLVDLGKPVLSEDTVAVYVGKGAENLVNRSLTGSMTEKASPELYAPGHGQLAKPLHAHQRQSFRVL